MSQSPFSVVETGFHTFSFTVINAFLFIMMIFESFQVAVKIKCAAVSIPADGKMGMISHFKGTKGYTHGV